MASLSPLPQSLQSAWVEVVLNFEGHHGGVERFLVAFLPVLELAWLGFRLAYVASLAEGILGIVMGVLLADAATYLFHYALDNGGRIGSFLYVGPMRDFGVTFNRVHAPEFCAVSVPSEPAWGGQAQLCVMGAVIALATYFTNAPVLQLAGLTCSFIANFVFEFHRLAHMRMRNIEPRAGHWRLGTLVKLLQDSGLALGPRLHRLHHLTQHGYGWEADELVCGHWGLVNGASDFFLDPIFSYVRGKHSRCTRFLWKIQSLSRAFHVR
mmetsp:Transcript_46691/g.85617  ORF Transcript_46691/g.85617 Transcript_46691/m.85617 type:complete len:267 (-) Transcript_46691:61-861(-)